jgi:predicted CoA-binding protein
MITRSVKKGLVLPNQAIWQDANAAPYIRVVEGKQRRDVYIKLGIVNETAAEQARAAGLEVIMDTCLGATHRFLRLQGKI